MPTTETKNSGNTDTTYRPSTTQPEITTTYRPTTQQETTTTYRPRTTLQETTTPYRPRTTLQETTTTYRPRTTLQETTTTYEPPPEESDSDMFTIDETELSETDLKIHHLIDKIKSYSYNLKKVYKNNNDISESFERMKQLNTDKKIDILWKYLIDNYKNNFEYMLSNYDKIKKKNMKLLENKNKLKKLKIESKTLKQKISTKEKMYKLNFNRYNEMIFETNLLKNFMMFLMFLLIIPILRLSDVINKTLCVVSYCSLVAIGIIYSVYLFMSDRENRDNVYYNKLNFGKPDETIKEPATTGTATTGSTTEQGTIIVEHN